MNGLRPEIFYPVFQVVVAILGLIFSLIGGLWLGFRWLRKVIRDEFEILTGGILKRIEALEKRDEERAAAIQRLHQRVDEAVVLVAKGKS